MVMMVLVLFVAGSSGDLLGFFKWWSFLVFNDRKILSILCSMYVCMYVCMYVYTWLAAICADVKPACLR